MKTKKQITAQIDKIMSAQAKGHLICRTCGVIGCCIMAHDNLLPARKGDRFEKNGEVHTI